MESANLVEENLKYFTEYFVDEFESKLRYYLMVLEGSSSTEEKKEEYLKAVTEACTGSFGDLVGLVENKIRDAFDEKKNKMVADKYKNILYDFKKNEDKYRQILTEAAIDIFQSFEMQLMTYECECGGDVRALQKLAKGAVSNFLNYYILENVQEVLYADLITRGVTFTLNKRSVKQFFATKNSGGTVMYKDMNNILSTNKVFMKVGLVLITAEGTEYYKKQGTNTEKYGYRRPFKAEIANLEALKSTYEREEINKKYSEYNYILKSNIIEAKSKELLKHLNGRDPKLMEQRIKICIDDAIKELLNELQFGIFEEIHTLITKVEAHVFKKYEEKDKNSKVEPSVQKTINIQNNKIGVWNTTINN